jgi:hypothetical protein
MAIGSRYRHTLVVRRMVASAGTAAETAGGADTTLTSDTAVGAMSLPVASAAGIADGNWLRVGDTGETEIRQVATGGVAGLVVTVTAPFTLAHDAGDQVREVDDAGTPALDDYGQPVASPVTVATVPGLIQPRRAREVELASQAGAAIGEHVGYMAPLAGLGTDCWIEVAGVRYDVLSMPDAAGLGHHLELGLRRVG